jgi:hypothetical protein
MERATKYLEILKIKNQNYCQLKISPVLRYHIFRLQRLCKKLNKNDFKFKKFFLNEIKDVMFGYGNSRYPNKDSIKFVEKLIVQFVSIIVIKINFLSFLRLSKRPVFGDILFTIRKDPSKTKRIVYLIKMQHELAELLKQTKNSNQISKEVILKCKKPF